MSGVTWLQFSCELLEPEFSQQIWEHFSDTFIINQVHYNFNIS